MKKLLVIFSPIVFIFFVACGGDDSAPPPTPPQLNLNNPNDQQALRDLQMAALKAKKDCSDSMSPIFLVYAMKLQSGGGAGMPFMPPPSGGECSNSLVNFIMQYATLAGGQYAQQPDTQQWMASQIGGIVNRIGGYLISQGVQITPQLQRQLFVVGINYAKQSVIPGLSPSVRGPACSTFTTFGGGC